MTTFAIDTDNNITAFTAAAQVPEGQPHFASREGVRQALHRLAHHPLRRRLERLRRRGPLRHVEAGQEVHGPQDGGQPDLEGHPSPDARPRATGGPRRAEEGQGDQTPPQGRTPTARDGSKKAQVLDLIKRPEGATLKDIMAVTGWQAHSVRGFISGSLTKKMGIKIESLKRPDGDRAYKVAQ